MIPLQKRLSAAYRTFLGSKQRRGTFSDMAATDKRKIGSYTLGRVILRGDRSGRAPAIYEAHDGGIFLFAKIWSRTGSGVDLQALWNHEICSLLRIGSYPRAADYFVRIRNLGADDSRHWIIIDAGDRKLLSQLLAERTKHVWIRDLNAAQNRRRMWEGVRRVATGLGILHGEGTLHRSLDSNCIFCDQEGTYDLRLGGFEWSLRISAMQARADADRPNRISAPELAKGAKARSFASDWFDLGVLIAEIIGLNVIGRGPRALAGLLEAVEKVSYFTSVEKDVMRRLLAADPELRLSRSSDVLQALSEAGSSVRNRSIFAQKPLYVGFSWAREANSQRRSAISAARRAGASIPIIGRSNSPSSNATSQAMCRS
jgi:serine/threonine protein kinase